MCHDLDRLSNAFDALLVLFFDRLGITLMSCHNIDFVAFHFARKYDLRLLGENSVSKLSRHVMRAVCIQTKLLANLRVGQIEPHEVEAKYPNAKRLVVPCKNGSREIIEFSFTVAALITLSIPLRFIKTAFGNVAGTAFMASDAIGPTHLTNLFKAFSIIHQKQKRESHPWQPIVANVMDTPKP